MTVTVISLKPVRFARNVATVSDNSSLPVDVIQVTFTDFKPLTSGNTKSRG